MLFILLLTTFLNANEVTFNFYDWHYERPIEIDSVRIVNYEYEIDVVLDNLEKMNIEDFIKYKSVESDKFKVSLVNSFLEIKSNEIISDIKLVNILGQEIFSESIFSNNFKSKIELNDEFLILIINIHGKIYTQKILNNNSNIMLSPPVVRQNDFWEMTFYKKNYKDTTIIYENLELEDSLDLYLKRIEYQISLIFNIDSVYYSSYFSSSGDYPGQDIDTIYNHKYDLKETIYLFGKNKPKKIDEFMNCKDSEQDVNDQNLFYYFFISNGTNGYDWETESIKLDDTENIRYIMIENVRYSNEAQTSCRYEVLKYEFINVVPLINGFEYSESINFDKLNYKYFSSTYGRYGSGKSQNYKLVNSNNDFITIKIKRID